MKYFHFSNLGIKSIISYIRILFAIVLLFNFGCNKENGSNNPSLQVPILSTSEVTSITFSSALSGGNITSDGGSNVTMRGVCWSTGLNPTLTDSLTKNEPGAGNFLSNITGLMPNTLYYMRAYATNSVGTGYGNIISLKTPTDEVVDLDGNIYHQVKIGTQIWMVENLKTTKFSNGDPISNVSDSASWSNLTSPGYCDYKNNSANSKIYGRLYNYYAVNDSRKLAPEGWHVPTFQEWRSLILFMGGDNVAGGKLKETGTAHWSNPNTGATNEVGFTALPGGWRPNTANFTGLGTDSYYWQTGSPSGWGFSYNDIGVFMYVVKNNLGGFSVRCIKD